MIADCCFDGVPGNSEISAREFGQLVDCLLSTFQIVRTNCARRRHGTAQRVGAIRAKLVMELLLNFQVQRFRTCHGAPLQPMP